jgi:hypothetical protein
MTSMDERQKLTNDGFAFAMTSSLAEAMLKWTAVNSIL